MATPLETYKSNYDNSEQRQNSLKWQNATINDVASKYGFDFSKDYANQQAETVAQAQRNQFNNQSRMNQSANMQTMKELDSGLKDGIIGTENNFFQTYLAQRQNQSNRGINSGMQADQDLRLGMNQQSVLAGLYRDTNNNRSKEMDRFNNENSKIQDALALVEQQKLSEAEKMYQDLLTKGYGMLGTERGWYNTLDQQQYGQYQDQINNWYKEQDLLMQQQQMAEARAARQRAAQDAAAAQAAQQRSINDALKNYQDQLGRQSTPLSPIQQYTNASNSKPGAQAVNNLLSQRGVGYATSNAFTNPMANYANSVAGNSSMSAWDKMKMLEREGAFWK